VIFLYSDYSNYYCVNFLPNPHPCLCTGAIRALYCMSTVNKHYNVFLCELNNCTHIEKLCLCHFIFDYICHQIPSLFVPRTCSPVTTACALSAIACVTSPTTVEMGLTSQTAVSYSCCGVCVCACECVSVSVCACVCVRVHVHAYV